MSLQREFERGFDSDVRARGRRSFERGAVKITSADTDLIQAEVQGTDVYEVTLSFSGNDGFEYGCTCPYFDTHECCKHVWATYLQAREQGLLPSRESPPPMRGLPERLLANLARLGIVTARSLAERPSNRQEKAPRWKSHLRAMQNLVQTPMLGEEVVRPWPANKRLVYVIDAALAGDHADSLTIRLCTQALDRQGTWGRPKELRLTPSVQASLPDVQDQAIVQMLMGASEPSYYRGYYSMSRSSTFELGDHQTELVLKQACQTGRCLIVTNADGSDAHPLSWDDGPPWELWLELRPDASNERYSLMASVRRGEERLSAAEVTTALSIGWIIARGQIARFRHFGAYSILAYLRQHDPITLAVQQGEELVSELVAMPVLPKLDLPEDLRIEQIAPPMRPKLKILPPPVPSRGDDRLLCRLGFDYGGREIGERDARPVAFDRATRVLLQRDPVAEQAAAARLNTAGCRFQYNFTSSDDQRRLAPNKLAKTVRDLTAEGWLVEAEGRIYRQSRDFKINVSSGIDWFELQGAMDFGGASASLPALLAALRKGENTITLDDGTIGILPEQWLSRYGLLAQLVDDSGQQVRFTKRQIGLIDALLASVPEATFDEAFSLARQQLCDFEGVRPLDPPEGFIGQLRPYQKDGLGWLWFLNRFGFGGCLADDMGLGKTIQVLALLESRRGSGRPSLVVVPRSLVFNWIDEARKFTPQLRALDHTGTARARSIETFGQHDVVLTTYGTLRLDIAFLKDVQFDYAILDEAQAIKNGSSESAKAARLLRADHRLVLSGTPVQNHLGELWSLFEFLNPGMLGGVRVLRNAGVGSAAISVESRELLSRALRPFILRRTKEQVAKDLPAKTEQTIWCDLEPGQRKLYDELRDHYRVSLFERISTEGLNKAKIQVLEALLRLRQAACHPGLIDKARAKESSAKLDALIPQLAEVIDEGHKVLVFSQFTSMLAILKQHLDNQKLGYEYLDGKTRDRQAKVERFQNDPECKLFLISLKAGGLGLNLTAAEYVFLLDPWWNPAIESQAIDRAHRIGQTRHVFAYRLIARDTVEQKVLDLQSRKKDLADMIINADNSLISKMGKEDLELLLS